MSNFSCLTQIISLWFHLFPPMRAVALCAGRRLPESLLRLVTLLNVKIFLFPRFAVGQQETASQHNEALGSSVSDLLKKLPGEIGGKIQSCPWTWLMNLGELRTPTLSRRSLEKSEGHMGANLLRRWPPVTSDCCIEYDYIYITCNYHTLCLFNV